MRREAYREISIHFNSFLFYLFIFHYHLFILFFFLGKMAVSVFGYKFTKRCKLETVVG